jgi:catechol 2,3-dioxygenase-like lactoylglutathione lyase family enzyme
MVPDDALHGITHLGILVEDVAAESERFAALLGVTFRPPATLLFPRVETPSGVDEDVEVVVTYCGDGPPYFELLEATGDTVWSPAHGLGPHHVGGYVADIAAEDARLEGLGLRVEARIHSAAGDHIITFFEPSSAGGLRVELLNEALYPNWRDWVTGGPPPGHRRYPSS